ncbi:hypothetical protein BHM03_00048510, partial [Ensete ventricosum]
ENDYLKDVSCDDCFYNPQSYILICGKKGDAPDDAAESEPKDSASNSTVAA